MVVCRSLFEALSAKPYKQIAYHCSQNVIDTLFPHNCFSCNKFTASYGLCNDCWQGISFVPNSICDSCGLSFLAESLREDGTCYDCHVEAVKAEQLYEKKRALLFYDAKSKKLIHRLKYGNHTFLADYFAGLLAGRYENDFIDVDAIVPVPMHPLRRILRTYNQAQLLAKKLADIMYVPLYSNMLKKTRFSKTQASLNRKERLQNLQGSIKLSSRYSHRHFRHILLIDDVYTTGATAKICIEALKELPQKPKVSIATIATTIKGWQ